MSNEELAEFLSDIAKRRDVPEYLLDKTYVL